MDLTISLKKQIKALRENPTKIKVYAARFINSTETKKLIIDSYGDSGYYHGELLRSSNKSSNHCSINDKKEEAEVEVVEDLMIDYNDDEVDNGNILHGLGTMEYLDGRIYEGQWKNGQWSGKGKATYPNGDIYEGMYKEDQRHGQGLYKWHNGRKYQGDFINDQRCGYGIYTWADNSKYEGEFQDGLRHGEGKYILHDGSVYIGGWRRGSRQGSGKYHLADGRIYKGEWMSGKAHGYGIELRSDGSVRHDGQWENGNVILVEETDAKNNKNNPRSSLQTRKL